MVKDFGLVFWLHLFLIVLVWISPLWADWVFILFGIITLHIYWFIFQGCHLTKLEAGEDKDNTFYYYYLSKYFSKLNKKRVKTIVRWILPIVILLTAYYIQEFAGLIPYLDLKSIFTQ